MIVTSSTAAFQGLPFSSHYAATKGYDLQLAEGLWYELKPHGIDVLGLVLGATDTPALGRIGMRTDTPGFVAADAAEVAQEGLDHLGLGPVRHTGGTEATAQHLRAMPRAEAVTLIAQSSKAMMKS